MISSGPREVKDRDFRLREVTMDDAADLYRWRMDEASRPMFRSTGKVPYETHLAFMGRYFDPANTDRWFVIEEYGAPVGSIVLYDLDAARGEAEWGRLVIAPELRSRGLATHALKLLVRHARELGLRRLRCEVLEGNAHADRLYRALGFVETGVEEAGGRRFVQLALDLEERR
jgi:RimJ/RimL family protein N-acetyltransferase